MKYEPIEWSGEHGSHPNIKICLVENTFGVKVSISTYQVYRYNQIYFKTVEDAKEWCQSYANCLSRKGD